MAKRKKKKTGPSVFIFLILEKFWTSYQESIRCLLIPIVFLPWDLLCSDIRIKLWIYRLTTQNQSPSHQLFSYHWRSRMSLLLWKWSWCWSQCPLVRNPIWWFLIHHYKNANLILRVNKITWWPVATLARIWIQHNLLLGLRGLLTDLQNGCYVM